MYSAYRAQHGALALSVRHADPPDDREASRRRTLLLALPLLLAFCVAFPAAARAQANPTVQAGGSATFAKSGTGAPAAYPWEIVLAGSTVATGTSPNGWSVSYNSSTLQFTVGAPSSASVATGYTVRCYSSGVASATFDVVAATLQLSSLAVSPSPVIGGNGATGTVTLSQTAPAGGIVITLTSANAGVASVPASVTVAQGRTTATFSASTSVVAASTNVTLSASYNGVTQTAALTVNPVPVLSALPVAGGARLKRGGSKKAVLGSDICFDMRPAESSGHTLTTSNQFSEPSWYLSPMIRSRKLKCVKHYVQVEPFVLPSRLDYSGLSTRSPL